MRPAWVEIDLQALRKNIRNLKNLTAPGVEFMGVIKADAYGHGVLKVAGVLREEKVNRFGVVLVQEGIELRENGFEEPILILGQTLEDDYEQIVKYNLTPTIFQFENALVLNNIAKKNNKKVKIHLKVDTGMGRLGFLPKDKSIEEIKKIMELPNLYVEGIFSHLASADQKDGEYVYKQFASFKGFITKLGKEGIKIPLKHLANSAATINFPQMHLDMVRPGTSLYGLYPSREMAAKPTIDLYPVMSIKAKLVHIKQVPVRTSVSYGCTFTTKRESVLGVVPMGYVDGVFRLLANKGEVLIRGKRCPIVGTICMDQFMVDLTDLKEVQIGDEVVFLGKQGKERITADEIGLLADTISIEVVTRLGKRMPMLFIE